VTEYLAEFNTAPSAPVNSAVLCRGCARFASGVAAFRSKVVHSVSNEQLRQIPLQPVVGGAGAGTRQGSRLINHV